MPQSAKFPKIAALLKLQGVSKVEIGKNDADFTMIDEGIDALVQAKSHLEKGNFDVSEIERILCLSNKLRALKLLDQESTMDEEAFKVLKKHLSTLKKLRIVMRNKIDKSQPQLDLNKLTKNVEQVLKSEKKPVLKDLEVPDHLLCQISGDLMKNPVLIESGMTYEREAIERYMEVQAENAEVERQQAGDEFTEDEYRNFFRCPVTQKPLRLLEGGKIWMAPNRKLKAATDNFLERNPWAFEFDPR